jgi:aspartyl/glutamyl-tRNA(Asn/Gln) amidotransferase C subunit
MAALAELAVAPADLPELTAQMDRIVGFVAQLTALGDLSIGAAEPLGPRVTPLRDDVVTPADLGLGPSDLAPEFVDGFFVVPRLGAMEEP